MNLIGKPQLDFKDIFAALFVFIGYLLFLSALHILSIETDSPVSDVLVTIFTWAVNILWLFIVMALSFTTIFLLKSLVYFVTVPKWKKERIKRYGR